MAHGAEKRLTRKQSEFLDQIIRFKAREGVPPTVREMQSFGEFRSTRSVMQFLNALEDAGFIKRAEGARNVRVVRKPTRVPNADRADTIRVPLLGNVAAGLPMLAIENIEGYVPVSSRLASGQQKYFLLRVNGDSMNLAGINDRDLALIRQQNSADDGQRVLALIDDEATIKRLRIGTDAIVLEPVSSNPKHSPIVVDRDFCIQGVVVASIPIGTL